MTMKSIPCKICHYENSEIKYHLKNSNVLVCSKCNFHYSNYLDNIENNQNLELKDVKLSEELKNYLKDQLQHNKRRFQNHVDISFSYFLQVNRAIKLLDVGCGGGLFLSLMKNRGADCYGIELDKERLKFAREETGLKTIFPYPIQSNYWTDHHASSFDLITLWDVIEHVNAPRETFEAATKLLKKGGLLIMDTPCRDTFYHRCGELTYKFTNGKYPTFLNIMYSDHPYGHKQIFSRSDIIRLYQEYNFDLLDIKTFHELSFPNDYYLKKMLSNERLVNLITPLVNLLIKVSLIRNKMIIAGKFEGHN